MPKFEVKARFTRVYEYSATITAKDENAARIKALLLDSTMEGVTTSDYDGDTVVLSVVAVEMVCPICEGVGTTTPRTTEFNPCLGCNGTGYTTREDLLAVGFNDCETCGKWAQGMDANEDEGGIMECQACTDKRNA